ncbi:hypothetical protein HPB50_013690 [Hyalomma asiaticum]|uniref:Uncharacterized protein n=1 Tax=Hyalomma asiaticum TaxID=266040 RepID=A0ACB7RZX2_HYAAI|nr:hypothetical protein HPB50_013690 [Hyalomma asiaticum]
MYAPDAEPYTVFANLFDPLIDDYHKRFPRGAKHLPTDVVDINSLVNMDTRNELVISTRECLKSLPVVARPAAYVEDEDALTKLTVREYLYKDVFYVVEPQVFYICYFLDTSVQTPLPSVRATIAMVETREGNRGT